MPRTATHLHIPQPCAESWAAMTPTGPGRHCAACQKVVVDFTQKTDGEILAYLARAGAAPCGRFRAGQLARPLQPAETASRWRSWLASALALGGVLGSGRAAAQAGGNYFSAGPTPTAVSPIGANAPVLVPPAGSAPAATPSAAGGVQVLRGVVLDAPSGDRLPGVTVLLKGTNQGVSTDMKGEFVLEIPASASAVLRISFVGYTNQEVPAASAMGTAPLTIKLEADVKGMLGEVVMIGGYTLRNPWPWHPRRLYQWGKYQLGRPFRR